MELLIMIDAFKRASAGRITAVMPYYAYGRSDKKDQPRVPITARLVADMLTVAGADRVLTMDLHQGQIQGFFSIPVDELTAINILSRYIKAKELPDMVVVSELGFAKKARNFAEILSAPLAIVEKRRLGNEDRTELMNIIGEVRGKTAVIIDDEIDTAGSLIEAVEALVAAGAREVYSCATHGVFSLDALARIHASALAEVIVTDTIPLPPEADLDKITVKSVAPLFGEAIKRIHRGESVGALFSSEVQLVEEMTFWGGEPAEDGSAEGEAGTGEGVDPEPAAVRIKP
jgi:ribose-phosphate pyrophosphokinase